MSKSNLSSKLNLIYFSLPLFLFILQAVYTFNSFNQIRYEELEESVVNPYWVYHGVVQNGATSNLGWYFLLILVYKIFGFSLFTGKIVRLFISLIALVCLASVLKKYLGARLAWLPLLTIGLSPTILYFNTQQTIYALDIGYLLICIFFLSKLNLDRPSKRNTVIQILTFALAMAGFLTYPSFIYYLPGLFIYYFYKLFKSRPELNIQFFLKNILITFVSFLTPLALSFLYITNRNLLIYDPVVKSGIFRGAGFFRLDLSLFLTNLKLNFTNMFLYHFGYYYEIEKVEFSDFYPVLSIIFIIFITIIIFIKKTRLRFLILLVISPFILNFILANFTLDPTPGMRRQTGTLVTVYGLFVLAWYFVNNLPKKLIKFKKASIIACLLLLFHHVISYPINYIHLKDPSQFRETVWFKTLDNPAHMLDGYLETVQKEDLRLICLDEYQKPLNCRYSEVFAAVGADCLWNNLSCHDIYGYDIKTKNYIKLMIRLFNDYYFGLYGREIIAT